MITYETFEINDFKGTDAFFVNVEASVTTGGSNFYVSDDPLWVDCEILNIYSTKRAKPVSKKLYEALMTEYEDWFSEVLCENA
jgi:hypothetical protein